MTGYFLTAVGTAVLVFAASALLPDNKRLEKVLEFALGLVLAGSVFLPVFGLFGGMEDLRERLEQTKEEISSPEAEGWLDAQKENAVAQAVTVSVCERFSLDPKDVLTELTLFDDGTGVKIQKVKLYLQNKASYADLSGILRYLESNYCEDCEVIPYAKE